MCRRLPRGAIGGGGARPPAAILGLIDLCRDEARDLRSYLGLNVAASPEQLNSMQLLFGFGMSARLNHEDEAEASDLEASPAGIRVTLRHAPQGRRPGGGGRVRRRAPQTRVYM